ncbi:MAG: glycosyltransferase family 2 protein [Nibricoccus sp.]
MRVSFIIPLYNCLPLTQAMLASLQATLPAGLDHEIIFVDDGSTDGTRDWLHTLSIPHLRVLLNDRNLGYAAANNRAASLASGDILVLLNNDLVLTPHWLEPMLAAHAAFGPRAGLVGNVQRSVRTGGIDHTGFIITEHGKPEQDRTPPARFRRIKKVPAVTGACLLTTRALWKQLGGFDEQFVNGCEDLDLCFKASNAGLTNAVALCSVIHHHISASPGRRSRDEENSRKLTVRWRAYLRDLGSRAACRDYLARKVTAATLSTEPLDILQAGLYAAHLMARPPTVALRLMSDALDDEFLRWKKTLPPQR